ncbi:hypothetical protein EON80_31360, partial [bacterium]
ADEFRRLMSKFRDTEEMEAMRAKFVESAIATHAGSAAPVTLGLANRVFDLVSKFVGYGFCRSHAAAFARTVYQSAYLKAHHPAAYMAGVLEHLPGFFPIHSIVEEARLFNITVLPACIAWSGVKYKLERLGDELAIRVPFTAVKNVSPEAAADIVLERSLRPFESIDDLYRRLKLKSDVWDTLAKSGAFDIFGTRREVLWHLRRLKKTDNKTGSLFDVPLELEMPRDHLLMRVLTIQEETNWNFQTQSLTTGPHPMALRRPELEKLNCISVHQAFQRKPGSLVRIAGAVISRQRPPTAKGFTFMIVEDESGRIPTALQPALYEQFSRVLREGSLIVEGRLEARGNGRQYQRIPLHLYREDLV